MIEVSLMHNGTKFELFDFYLKKADTSSAQDALVTLISGLTMSRSLKVVVKFLCFTNQALTNSHS